MILERAAKIIAENSEFALEDIQLETSFEELGFDSLDTVDLLMKFEEEFSTSIELSENLKTVGDIVKLLEEAK